MTALPLPPAHLLTVAEYAALGEIESGYAELLEGRLLMSPSLVPDHNFASLELAGYQDPGAVTGGFTTTEPFPIRLELDWLF